MRRRLLGLLLVPVGLVAVVLLLTLAGTAGGTVGPVDLASTDSPTLSPAPTTGRSDPGPTATARPEGDHLSGEITVLAAASLADAFVVLADAFEVEHPGVRVTLGFGASSTLATQVGAGAPADVLATADERTMDAALAGASAGGAGATGGTGGAEGTEGTGGAGALEPVVFARNTMALAVPTADPGDVEDLADLSRPGVTFAMCAEVVPCGAAARRVLERAGVEQEPVTFEPDVGAVLTKVVLTEVDAGIVYASDVRPTSRAVLDGTLRVVEIPPDLNTTNRYPIAALPSSRAPDVAAAFVEHVLSRDGRQMLRDAGFLGP